jgi:hypothetical protein
MKLSKLHKTLTTYDTPAAVEIDLYAEGLLCISGNTSPEIFNRVEDTDGWDD